MTIATSKVEQSFLRWPATDRVRLGFTISDLAAAAGIHPARLVEWETGQSSPSDEERARLDAELVQAERNRERVPASAIRQHIWLDEHGVAWLDDTNRRVKEVVEEHAVLHWTPDQIHEEHPDLSLSQIHAALAYYFDHQEALDADLARDARIVEELRRGVDKSPLIHRLRESGRLR